MYLFTASEVHHDNIGPYLTVILRGFGDMSGRIRGSVEQLSALSENMQAMNDLIAADNAKMVCGVSPIRTIARRAVRHLDRAFSTIAQAGLEVTDLEPLDFAEEETADAEEDKRANV